MKPKIGDRVTVREKVEAYYSNYGSFRGTHVFFSPGMTGVVAAIDVPCVRHTPGESDVFCCVDFDSDVIYNKSSANPRQWRCSVKYKNLVILKEENAARQSRRRQKQAC